MKNYRMAGMVVLMAAAFLLGGLAGAKEELVWRGLTRGMSVGEVRAKLKAAGLTMTADESSPGSYLVNDTWLKAPMQARVLFEDEKLVLVLLTYEYPTMAEAAAQAKVALKYYGDNCGKPSQQEDLYSVWDYAGMTIIVSGPACEEQDGKKSCFVTVQTSLGRPKGKG